MKTCPFCKEGVNEEAIKCRYCQSMLLPVQEAKAADDRQITYVVDRDLVRFGKFAGAVLAVFLVAGGYLFGFKLDSALEKVRNTQDELRTAHEKIVAAQEELKAAQAAVKGLKQDVETTLAAAKRTLGEISEQKVFAIAIVGSMRELTPAQTASLPLALADQSDKTRRDQNRKYWANGATLRIRFLGGSETQRDFVRRAAEEWAIYSNLKFSFVAAGDSEIRVSFKPEGSWSFRGTDALVVPQSSPTMNLQWPGARFALRELGFAIGLIQEHSNPDAHLNWNKTLVYAELGGPPNNFSRETIDANIFQEVPRDKLGPYRKFDPTSIMTMDMPATWTNGVALGNPSGTLSDSDKALIARLYPRT